MKSISKVGIISSGKMGSNIFNYLSDFNFDLVWYTRNSDHKEVIKNSYQKKLKRQLKHGIINKEVYDFRFNYKIIDDLNELAECDLVIESVIEELEVKQELFKILDKITKSSCILASNSSSLLPSELSDAMPTKNRIIGMHFFYPVAFKNIIELIYNEFTDNLIIEKAKLFSDAINRFYIEQNENNAFILNRLLLQIQLVALDLVKKYKIGYKQFDDIAKKLVTEFGLFEIIDSVGHNTMYNAIMNYSRMDVDKRKYEPLLKEIQATHSNFYVITPEIKDLSEELEQEILNALKETALKYLQIYSQEFQTDLYSLKKGLDEFCGILL